MPLRAEDITVSYHHIPAVHHVSVDFKEGEGWAIIGPNGAGKSTLLQAIMGLTRRDTGHVYLDNIQPKDIAYLPQQSDTDRSQPLSVFELTASGLWYEIGAFKSPNKLQKQRVMQALERVGIQDFASRLISELSNGQFQRVLFARMLVQNARFLLLDEPFNAIDTQTTTALLNVLSGCLEQGLSVITVLHDYEQVRQYFDNCVLIAREKIASGKTCDVLTVSNIERANNFIQDAFDPNVWCDSTIQTVG